MRNGRNGGGSPTSVLFGTHAQVGVGRGLAEYRAGRPVVITDGVETLLTLPVEGLDIHRLGAFIELCAPVRPRLVITSSRARSLGLDADAPIALELPPDIDVTTILTLVAEATADYDFVPEPAGPPTPTYPALCPPGFRLADTGHGSMHCCVPAGGVTLR